MELQAPRQVSVLLIDGECVLCDRLASWVLVRASAVHGAAPASPAFKIATLQGKWAASVLGTGRRDPQAEQAPGTMIWRDAQGALFYRSEAMIRVLAELGFGERVLSRILAWIPVLFRDALYNGVARRRYRWFGRKSVCALPKNSGQNSDLRAWLLD